MNEIFSDIFTEIAALLFLASLFGAIGLRLKQPLIVSFIALGIFVGPSALDLISANDQVDLLSKLGIALLLFVVGLKLDIHIIRTMGAVALATGLGQVFFFFFFCLGIRLSDSPGFGHEFGKRALCRSGAYIFQHHYHCKIAIG